MPERRYTESEAASRLAAELPHWTLADGCLRRHYRTSGWQASLLLVNAIGHLAEAAWHHPDLTVTYRSVTVSLITHSAGAVTDKDFELARWIETWVLWRPPAGSALAGPPAPPVGRYLREE